MHMVSANYTLPTVLNTLKPPSGLRSVLDARTSATTPTTSTSSSNNNGNSNSGTDISTTFLNLLSTELQNQDPTDPVDSNTMVSQMISLNQLDQLISINQAVSGTSSAGTTGSVQPATNGDSTSSLSPSVAGAVSNQLPFDPNTMMPLNPVNAGALAATINSSVTASSMGSSSNNNNYSGGK
jgi:flagellar basal-body rod modification protein FlgD